MMNSKTILFSIALLACASANALPTLNIDSNGQILGASGVDVNGTLYDVQFLEGTCVDLFGGCDEATDFAFSTESDALAAATALLSSVFIDSSLGNFDLEPGLTNGCSSSTFSCDTLIPHGIGPLGGSIFIGVASNLEIESSDSAAAGLGFSELDTFITDIAIYGVFTPTDVTNIQEPKTLFLMALACAGMAWRMRRKV